MNSVQTHEHPATDTDSINIPDFLLMPVIETAFSVIQKSENEDVPTKIRRIPHFDIKSLNDSTARNQILQSLKNNNDFRERVEEEFFGRIEATIAYQQWKPSSAVDIVNEAASRNDLPLLASVLWLKRPELYLFGLGLVTASASTAIVENEQRDTLRADESRFEHLSQKVEKEKSRADMLKADVDRLETELRQERTAKRIGDQRYDAQIASLKKTIEEHDEVVLHHKEAKERTQQRFEREASRAQELEARLKILHDENKAKSDKISQLQEQLASALSSEVELNYEDLQALLTAQREAQKISDSLLAIMNKTRTIVSTQQSAAQTAASSGTIEATVQFDEPTSQVPISIVEVAKPSQLPKKLGQLEIKPEAIVLVDGYSVGHQVFRDLPRELQREKIIEALTRVEAHFNCSCVAIFDGESSTTRGRVQSKVHIVYSPSSSSAGDVIMQRIKVTPSDKSIVLISSDTQLISRIDSGRCSVMEPQKFIDATDGL